MASVSIQIDDRDLQRALKKVSKNLPMDIGAVNWKTTGRAVSIVAKDVTRELAVKQKVVKQHLSKRRVQAATDRITTGKVELEKSKRIPLRDFGARQTKKGVTARISKREGRKLYPGAFQGPRPGAMNVKWRGRVFKRKGPKRLPITQLHGVSPWGYVVKRNRLSYYQRRVTVEHEKQMVRRIKWRSLRR